MIIPLVIKRQLVRIDIPVMVAISVVLLIVSLDGQIGLLDGVLLFSILVVHTVMSCRYGASDRLFPLGCSPR